MQSLKHLFDTPAHKSSSSNQSATAFKGGMSVLFFANMDAEGLRQMRVRVRGRGIRGRGVRGRGVRGRGVHVRGGGVELYICFCFFVFLLL